MYEAGTPVNTACNNSLLESVGAFAPSATVALLGDAAMSWQVYCSGPEEAKC